MKVYIKTYGCQMNQRDSDALAAQLVANGHTMVDIETDADIILFNTCSVRDAAERKAKGKIGYVPPIEELENPNLKFATQIISDDGVTLGTYSYSTDNRIYVGYEDLSPYLVKALIATEDERFTEHSGIDARALLRAFVKRGILQQGSAGGGSTITQQLAKQFYSEQA